MKAFLETTSWDDGKEFPHVYWMDDGKNRAYAYARWGNPTFQVAEKTIAALEAFGVKDAAGNPLELKAFLHASGQAAMTTLFFSNLSHGDILISHFSLYDRK